MRRASAFIDGTHFFCLQRDVLNWNIDPGKFLALLREQWNVQEAMFFIGVDEENPRQARFLDSLVETGYSLYEKDMDTVDQGERTVKRVRLAVDFAVEVIKTMDTYDLAIIVAGNMEIEPLLEYLRSQGKEFIILTSPTFVVHPLRRLVGSHIVDVRQYRKELERVFNGDKNE